MTREESWGWWTVWETLDQMESDLERQIPSPIKNRIIDPQRPYTITELKELIQQISSYLSSLAALHGKVAAQCHGLKNGIETGLEIAMVTYDSQQSSLTGKKAEILATNETFKNGRKKQIEHESCLTFLDGWIRSYNKAYDGVSRMISVELGEAEHITGRTP